MKRTIIFIGIIMILSSLAISSYAQGDTFSINSDSTIDGTLYSKNVNYFDALNGSNLAVDQTTLIYAGQIRDPAPPEYRIYRGYLSFNTSIIPDNHAIVNANISIQFIANTYLAYYELEVYNVKYGNSLDTSDWNLTETYEGILFNKTTEGVFTIHTGNVSQSNINKTGLTQYRFRVSQEGLVPYYDLTATALNSSLLVFIENTPNPTLNILTSEIPTPEIVEIEGTQYEGNITLDGSESYDGDGTIVNYTWTISSDRGTTTLYGETPTYYFREGIYEITLTILDDAGVENSVTTSVTIYTPTGLLSITMIGLLFVIILMITIDKVKQATIQNTR